MLRPTQPYSGCGEGQSSRHRIIRHQSPIGRWEAVNRRPDSRLAEVVDGEYQGWVEHEVSFSRRREIPAAIVPMILNLVAAFRIHGPSQHRGVGAVFDSFVAGLHESFRLVEALGPAACLQANLTPLGAYLVFGVSMAGLTNRCVALDDLLGKDAGRLVERLHDARGWERRFEILDAFLLGRLAAQRPTSAGLIWAWRRLEETGGRVLIHSLAEGICCSHKHMIAQFREQIGLPPKMLGRIFRFQSVAGVLERGEDHRWVEVAHDRG